jgi:hypothetical protein
MNRLRLFLFVLPCLLFVGFSNLAADDKDKGGDGGITVDKAKRTISIDARIAPRKLEHLKEIYPIEVIACWAHPEGKKAHETVVTIKAKPSEVHKAIEGLGVKPGKPALGEESIKNPPQGPKVNIFIEVPGPDGKGKRLPIDRVLIDPKTKKPMPKVEWRFTGSAIKQPDPAKPKMYGADMTGTLIAIFPVTDDTVFQTNLTMKEEKYVKLDTNTELLPKEGTPVKLIIEVPEAK